MTKAPGNNKKSEFFYQKNSFGCWRRPYFHLGKLFLKTQKFDQSFDEPYQLLHDKTFGRPAIFHYKAFTFHTPKSQKVSYDHSCETFNQTLYS